MNDISQKVKAERSSVINTGKGFVICWEKSKNQKRKGGGDSHVIEMNISSAGDGIGLSLTNDDECLLG